MKKILVISAACLAVFAGVPNRSVADETLGSGSDASVGTTVADLERRIVELEAKVGGKMVKPAFQPRGPKVRQLRRPAQESSLNLEQDTTAD